MAADSFQNEIPASRVNIRYVKDTGGAKESVELPHRVMVLGDFTQREDDTPLEDLKKISVDKDNFNEVMKSMDISLDFNVPNKLDDGENDLSASLAFKGMSDFQPEKIAEQVPELKKLVQVRGLLEDLKARVINNKQFRKELERILGDEKLTQDISAELSKITAEAKTNDNNSEE